MIATLMVERMPLATADKLTCGVIQLIAALCQRHGLYQLWFLSPAAAGTVEVVMSIPVVYQLTKLAGKDTLLWFVFLEVIAWPSVNHIIVVCHSCGMNIGSCHRTVRIWILIFGYLQCLKREVKREAGLVQDWFPHQHRWMITVAAYDITGVLLHLLGKLRVFIPVLPPWGCYDNKES